MSSLQTKNMVAAIGCIISSSIVPSAGDLGILSDLIFYCGVALLFLSVIGSDFLLSKQVEDNALEKPETKIQLPLFKVGIVLVLLSILINIINIAEAALLLVLVVVGNLCLIASFFFERKVPNIFTEYDRVKVKKIITFAVVALCLTAFFYFSHNAFGTKLFYFGALVSFFSGLISLLGIFLLGLYRIFTFK